MSTDPLITEMKKEHHKWSRSTVLYGGVNVAIRLFLIVASGLVAADKSLLTVTPLIGPVIPYLAVAVTVVTAIDSWLKPRDKWRGFMEDRDDLADILLQLTQPAPNYSDSPDSLRKEFTRLRRRHRNKNVY